MKPRPEHVRRAIESVRTSKALVNGTLVTNGEPAMNYPPELHGDARKGPMSFHPEKFGFPVVASKLQVTTTSLAWLWRGFIAEKGITLFSALWKIGKTTLLAHLVRNMGKGIVLCGHEVTPANVLYVSEEHEPRWAKRRDALGIGDNVHFLCRPFKAKPSIAQWREFIAFVKEQAERIGAHLIVFDTLSSLWPVQNENDAGEVQAALMPLWTLAAASGLLLVHHLKKGDGQQATGSRGSGALPGFVDTIIELRRHDVHDRHSRKRVITGYGRDEETPAEIIIELDAETSEYRGLGDQNEAKHAKIKITVCKLLPTEEPGMTFDEIKAKWPADRVPAKSVLLDALREGTDHGDWRRHGTGTKGYPYRYSVQSGKPG